VYIETAIFTQTAGLAMAEGLPFDTYGENVWIAGQNALIILLIWAYSKSVPFREKALIALALGAWAYALLTPGLLGAGAMWWLSIVSVFLGLICKLP